MDGDARQARGLDRKLEIWEVLPPRKIRQMPLEAAVTALVKADAPAKAEAPAAEVEVKSEDS